MPSLGCLVSALTQAGRGDLLFRFASSVQSCCWEGGAAGRYRSVWIALPVFRPHWVCPAHGCLCFPRLHCSDSQLLYMERALLSVRFQFSGPPQKRTFSCTCVLCLPQPQWFRQPAACVHSPGVWRAFPLCGPSARHWWGLRKSLDRNWEPVCSVGGGGCSGAEFAPFPSPCLLPPAGMGRLFSGVSQSLCLANHQRCILAS